MSSDVAVSERAWDAHERMSRPVSDAEPNRKNMMFAELVLSAVSKSHTSSTTVTHGGSTSSSAPPQSIPNALHVRPDDSDEHPGSGKLKLSDPGDLPSNAPMISNVSLSGGDTRVECSVERFERGRVSNKSSDPVLSQSAGGVSDERFLEVPGLDGPARSGVVYDLLKLEQSLNDIHVAEIVSQPKTMATLSRTGLTHGLIFDMSRTCLDLDVQANSERQRGHLHTERPVLLIGWPKCEALKELHSLDRRDPKFQENSSSQIDVPEVVDGNLSLTRRSKPVVFA